jgi:hypothetical protein
MYRKNKNSALMKSSYRKPPIHTVFCGIEACLSHIRREHPPIQENRKPIYISRREPAGAVCRCKRFWKDLSQACAEGCGANRPVQFILLPC